MNEVTRALAWINSTLSASSAVAATLPGGVWRGIAPSGTPAPYGVYTHQGGADVAGVAGIRLITAGVYQVVAYGPATNFAALVAAADALDAALQRASGPAGSDAYTLSCVREQPIALDETVSGAQWSRVGGLYRIQIHALV
jgi:hypothetical protein